MVDEEREILSASKPLHELIEVDEVVRVKDPDNGLLNFNMSMIIDDESVFAAFRSTDFKPPTRYDGKISFISTAKLIKDELVDIDRLYVRGYGIRLWDKYNAMEDPRLIRWRGSTWCLFTRPNFYITKITMAMVNLDTMEFMYFDDPLGREYTKNWMPYVDENDRLFFVTDIDPLRVYEVVDGEIIPEFSNKSKRYKLNIHGSSNIINFNGRLVGVIHGRFDVDGGWFYWHRIASWKKDWSSMKFGPPFFFEHRGVEFNLCIDTDKEFVMIPYSVMDESISILKINNKEFEKLL